MRRRRDGVAVPARGGSVCSQWASSVGLRKGNVSGKRMIARLMVICKPPHMARQAVAGELVTAGQANKDLARVGPPHLCTERTSANLLRTHLPRWVGAKQDSGRSGRLSMQLGAWRPVVRPAASFGFEAARPSHRGSCPGPGSTSACRHGQSPQDWWELHKTRPVNRQLAYHDWRVQVISQ
jgi:hypothetical protein